MSDDSDPRDDERATPPDTSPISDSASPTVPVGGGTGPAPGDAPVTGKRLGDFEILREIGRGGMGIVYEARQISLNRRVALKLLPPGIGMTQESVRRFEREAQTAAKLHHTNIVPVFAIGSEEGNYFFAMELIEGQPLNDILKDLRGGEGNPLMERTVVRTGSPSMSESPAPPSDTSETGTSSIAASVSESSSGGSTRVWFDTVARLAADVADALHYAHGRGVIHRDIKPGNLMLADDGRLCIMDFGLARVAQEPGMTVTGSFMGTPAYMSPEQIAAGRITVDERSDIYSLGAVLYEMLTFQRPFPGESRDEILTGIMTREPQSPRKANPRVPLDLETICQKAMEKDPSRRYQSADEMAADLRRFLNRGLITARRASPVRRMAKFVRRNPVPVTIGVAAIVLTLGIFGVTNVLTAQKSSETALRHVADARYFLSQGQYNAGVEATNEALAQSPGLAEARVLKARLLLRQGRTKEAVTEAEQIIANAPRDWTAHLIMAMAGRGARRSQGGASLPYIDAEMHMKVVEEEAPETADAFYVRSLLANSAKESIALLDRALARDPGHTEALTERIYRYEEVKNFKGALADAERLTALSPRSARGYQLIGWLHAQQYDHNQALADFARAQEIDPDDPITYRRRAALYGDLGRREEQLADLNRAVELDPEYPLSIVRRGWAHLNTGQLDAAEQDAMRAMELDPEYPETLALLWFLYSRQGRTEEHPALEANILRIAADWTDDKDRAELYGNLAMARLSARQFPAALALADSSILFDPEGAPSYAIRGMLKRILGDPVAARADCERCAEIDLTEPEELAERAETLKEFCGMRTEAIRDLTHAIELAPTWASLYNQRAHLYRRERNWEAAIADYTTALELSPNWGSAYNNRAIVHEREARLEDALADYDRAVEAGHDGWIIRWNRAWLLAEMGREQDAMTELDRIADLQQGNLSQRLRGTVLLHRGRVDEALTQFEHAIEKEPGDWRAPLLLARALAIRGDCARAVEMYALARENAPGVDDELYRLSIQMDALYLPLACEREARPRTAVDMATTYLNVGPSDPRGQYLLGLAHYRTGQYRKAAEALEAGFAMDERRPDPTNLFALAMTYQRLGQKQKALTTYRHGMDRLQNSYAKDPARLVVRDEAARVLGVAGAEKALTPTT